MAKIKRLGFLGGGPMARSHATVAAALGAEITAVCMASDSSPNREAFRKIAPHARHMTDGEALLADTELEGVVACLPWDVMPQWAVRLVQTPKPVLMEKPIGFSSDEARALMASVGKTATNKLVGYNPRLPPSALGRDATMGGAACTNTQAGSYGKAHRF